MSVGNIESLHDIVDEKIIKKVVGAKLLSDFQKKFNKAANDYSFVEMSDALNGGEDGFNEGCCHFDQEDESWVKVHEAYDKVTKAFKEKTGLRVSFVYFSGEGYCHDDLDSSEWYWKLNSSDVWIPKRLTKKAKEFQEKYGTIDTDQRFSCYG